MAIGEDGAQSGMSMQSEMFTHLTKERFSRVAILMRKRPWMFGDSFTNSFVFPIRKG